MDDKVDDKAASREITEEKKRLTEEEDNVGDEERATEGSDHEEKEGEATEETYINKEHDNDDEGHNDKEAEDKEEDDNEEDRPETEHGDDTDKPETEHGDDTDRPVEEHTAEDEEAEETTNQDDNDPEEVDDTEAKTEENDNKDTDEKTGNQDEEAQELTEEDREKFRQIFDRKAVNGRLDLKGFKVFFRLMGEVISTDEAEEMFEEGDKDDDNTIDFEELCRLYAKFSQEEQQRKEAILESVEKLFPGTPGESIELKKVEQLLMKLQQPDLDMRLAREKSDLGEDDIKYLVRSMDADGSGYISKEEFVDKLCQHIDI